MEKLDKKISKTFDILDKDDNGSIGIEELKRSFNKFHIKIE